MKKISYNTLLCILLFTLNGCMQNTTKPDNSAQIYNVRITDAEDKVINMIESDEFYVKADTSLNNGTPIQILLSIQNPQEQDIATELFNTKVEYSRIKLKIDLDDLLYRHGIKDEEIGYIAEKILWGDSLILQ
jgi:hypothetical protein